MLTRILFFAAILGICLTFPTSAIAADEKPAGASQTSDSPPPPPPAGWDEDNRPQPPRGGQMDPGSPREEQPRRPQQGRPGVREPVVEGPGNGPGGPGMGMGPGMGRGPMGGGMGMGGPGMGGGMGMGPMPGMGGFGGGRPGMNMMQQNDPEMFELHEQDGNLERRTAELCEQLRRLADDNEKAEVKKQLEEVVGRHFDVRQERRKLELKRLETELKRLNEAIEKRQAARDDIIKRRIMLLTGQNDPMEF